MFVQEHVVKEPTLTQNTVVEKTAIAQTQSTIFFPQSTTELEPHEYIYP